MKYVYGVFIGVVSVISLVWVIHLGIEGKPVAKIKLSEFATSQDLAKSIAMRLRQELKDHPIVFLGVDPAEPEHIEIWQKFLEITNEPGWKFDEVLIEKGLELKAPLGLGEQSIDVKEYEGELKAKWNSNDYRDKRVAIIVPHVFASQLIKDNPVQRLKLNPNEGRILSISIVPLGQSPQEEAINRLACVADGADYTGVSPLGCVIRKKSMFWSKPLKTGVRLGIVEQFGLHDFILFYRPIAN